MTGNLIYRLERLEQIERDQPKPGPLAALSAIPPTRRRLVDEFAVLGSR
jgi:hypothetical protein